VEQADPERGQRRAAEVGRVRVGVLARVSRLLVHVRVRVHHVAVRVLVHV
jgi:hypothetical protein